MIPLYTTSFKKSFRKYKSELREQISARLVIFAQNPFHPILKNHKLHGEYEGFRSIDITGDVRAVYEPLSNDIARFIDIGTHSELYE